MALLTNLTLNQTLLKNGTTFFSDKRTVVNDVMTWFTAFSCLATLVLNGILVTAIACRAELHTAFNLYIVNIAVTDICAGLTNMPGTILNGYHNRWPYNPLSCTILLAYGGTVFGAVNRYAHVLVTVNRFWAVTLPISYRQRHTKGVALALIAVTWIVVHVLCLPVIIRGRINVSPLDPNCWIDRSQQRFYSFVEELLCFTVPEVVIILMYAVILVKLFQREKQKHVKVTSHGMHVMVMQVPALAPESDTVKDHGSAAVAAGRSGGDRTPSSRRSKERVLAYLVIELLLCWTPNNVFYLLVASWAPFYWNTTFFAVQYFGQFLHSWVSPILCYLAMDGLRNGINRMFQRS
ncbi:hypothetical protein BV898_08775 [Hypsibius exemplaris]|uniref:G-protein coupled receptors family 1 profile domain-containing protein n=1 Tax=Hypsibius exemplaris TaxID=2072580 RepID=A0A1W0WPC0_HYPEX|nr:hypothetical protein BV898_08775 [Hypsibius exemplaris]